MQLKKKFRTVRNWKKGTNKQVLELICDESSNSANSTQFTVEVPTC
jgi:hypothetical protein